MTAEQVDPSWVITNKHGVKGIELSTGAHYGRRMPDGTFKTYAPVFVPLVCTDCCNYDSGEIGDYGSQLSPPYCERNLFFPTRRGTCKLHDVPLPKPVPSPGWPDPHMIPSPCPGSDRVVGRKRATDYSGMPCRDSMDQCAYCGAWVSFYRKRKRLHLAEHSRLRFTPRPGKIGELLGNIHSAMNPRTAHLAYSKHRYRGLMVESGWSEYRWHHAWEWSGIYRRWLESDQSEATAARMLREIDGEAEGRLWQWRASQ